MSIKTIVNLYSSFFELLRLRKKPQDIEISKKDLFEIIIIYFFIGYLVALILLSADLALPLAFLDICLLTGFTYCCLLICGFINRWRQTVAAIAGTSTIINVLAFPVLWLTKYFDNIVILSSISSGFLIGLLVWSIIINGHIFRYAFSILFAGGIAIAVLYYLLMNTLIAIFIPEYFQQ